VASTTPLQNQNRDGTESPHNGDEPMDDQMKQLRDKRDVTAATLRSLEPFKTSHAIAEKKRLADELQQLKHGITMLRPLEDRIETFAKALATRQKRLDDAGAKVTAAAQQVEEAMLAEEAAEKHVQSCRDEWADMNALLIAAQAEHDDNQAEERKRKAHSAKVTITSDADIDQREKELEALKIVQAMIAKGSPLAIEAARTMAATAQSVAGNNGPASIPIKDDDDLAVISETKPAQVVVDTEIQI
jgi:hypothetical protein